mmetsp:Transcript_47334/g.157763  ORF Transcript_47334/g.157763 Transcript_47334/m.157763 type:complete len:457 (-) Transcript_47334:885-2255(-)
MEHQVALLGEAALAKSPVAEPTAPASDPSAHFCANAAIAAEEQENGAQQVPPSAPFVQQPLAAAPLLKSAPPREPARETAMVVEAPEPMPTPPQAETEAKRVNDVTGEAEEAREAMEAEVPQSALAVDEPNVEGGDATTMTPAGSPASVIEVAGEGKSIGGDEGELGTPGSAGEEIAKLTASVPTEVQEADAPEAVDVSDVVPGAGRELVVGETEVAAVGEEVAPGSTNVGGEATPQGEAVTEETSLEAESGAESGALRVEAEHDDAQTESVVDPPTDAGETEAGELGEPEVAEEPGKTEAEDSEAEAAEEGREAQEAVNEADGQREGTTEPDAEAAKRAEEQEGGEEAEEAEGDKEAASEEAQKASADASEPAGAGSEEAPAEADGGATTEDSGTEPQPGAGGGAAPPPVAAPVESAPEGVELEGCEGPEADAEIAAPIEAAPEVGEGSEAEAAE